jgi:uncharacterized membrane protein
VNLVLDILQGMGLAGAAGMRPFLPTLLAGGLARADAGLDFDGTAFSFMESPVFLVVIAVLAAATIAYERRVGGEQLEVGPLGAAFAGVAMGLGALVCAASIDDRHDTWWYGIPIGLACAALGSAAARSLFGRVRARLDADAREALPVYAEGGALGAGGASVLFPPLAILVLGFLGWLVQGGRRRGQEKYAGLRILSK